MLIVLRLTLAILIPLTCGYSIIAFLLRDKKMPFLFHIASAFGLGLGTTAIGMFVMGLVGTRLNFWSVSAFLFLLALVCFCVSYKKFGITRTKTALFVEPAGTLHPMSILFCLFIVMNLYYVFWRSLTLPIASYDALATMAYKAKLIYFHQAIPDLKLLPHWSYPLLTPFNQAWIAFSLNEWSDILIKIIFPLSFTSFCIIVYYFLRQFCRKSWALFGVAVLVSSNLTFFHASLSYRDLLLMYFNCSTIIFLLLWYRTRLTALLWLASFFAGFATFTKLEGSAYLLIHLGLFFYLNHLMADNRRKKVFNTLRFVLPGFLICLGYHVFKFFHVMAGTIAASMEKTQLELSLTKLALIPDILLRFGQDFFYTNNWSLVWFALLISLVHLHRKWKVTEVRVLLGSLIGFMALYALTGLLTSNYIWLFGEKSSTTLSRLIIHFFPLAAVLLTLLNYDLSDEV